VAASAQGAVAEQVRVPAISDDEGNRLLGPCAVVAPLRRGGGWRLEAPVEVIGEGQVHAVIRHYKGNSQLFDELERRTDEIQQVVRGVPGFVSYFLVRTEGGGFSVSVYEDEAGTGESTRVAADWVRHNLPQLTVSPPEVIQGGVILHLGR
jgi:hypothetical protein